MENLGPTAVLAGVSCQGVTPNTVYAESTDSKLAVEEASNAITWAHAMGNCRSPTESQFVRSVLQGLQRDIKFAIILLSRREM